MIGFLDQEIVGPLIRWFLGDEEQTGAVERAGHAARAVLILLASGLLVPATFTTFGLLLSRFDGISGATWWVLGVGAMLAIILSVAGLWRLGVAAGLLALLMVLSLFFQDPVQAARTAMIIGIFVGLPVLTIMGLGMSIVVDVLAVWFGESVPKSNIAGTIRWYLGLLAWLVAVQMGLLITGVYAPTVALLLGPPVVAGLVYAAIAWNFALGWGRRLLVLFLTAVLLWVVAVSIPSGWWLATTGKDGRSALLYYGSGLNQGLVDRVRKAYAKQEFEFNSAELNRVLGRVNSARTPEELRVAQAELEKLLRQSGKNALLPRAVGAAKGE